MEGWVKLHRQLNDNELWLEKPFSKGQAWVDLVLNAAHKPTTFWVRGIPIEIERGQIGWSKLTYSKRWGWSRTKVARFIHSLSTRQMLIHQTSQQTTIITICNYNEFQGEGGTVDTPNESTDWTTERQQKDNRRDTYKNEKNVKNEKKHIYIPSRLSDSWITLWEDWPPDKRVGEEEACILYHKENQINRMIIHASLKKHEATKWRKYREEGKADFIPNIGKFMRDRYWRSEPETKAVEYSEEELSAISDIF